MSNESGEPKEDIFESFGINKNVFSSVPKSLRAWTTVSLIIALIVFSLGIIASAILLFRLGANALFSSNDFQESAKNFLFALAGAFGAPFLVWRTWVAHLQANAATAQANTAFENHLTGIFAKSVELLGSLRDVKTVKADGTAVVRSLPNLESRLGALYALERLLRESNKDQQAILETLCAYIRENSPIVVLEETNGSAKTATEQEISQPTNRTDVQAAITIIGRRPLQVVSRGKREGWRLDLRNANLVSYDFSSSNFDKSDFTGSLLSRSNLSGASFQGSTFLGTDFRKAHFNRTTLAQSFIENCKFKSTDIRESDFSNTTVENTDLREATVSGLNLSGANLDKAFGYSLEYALADVKKNGPGPFNAVELVRTNEFFKRVQHNEQTSVSQITRDVIDLMRS